MQDPWRVIALSSLLLAGVWACGAQGVEPSGEETLPPPAKQPAPAWANSPPALQGPSLSQGQPPSLAPAQPEETDRPLPINLATALRLADARPLVIAAAQASLRTAVAQYDEAKLLWLPNVYVGASYLRHDGGAAGNHGIEFINGRDQFLAGGGLLAIVSTADALFAPLALRQVVRARAIEVQAARNDALEAVAEAYFDVQQARGRLAGARDAVEKARKLVRTVEALGKGLAAPIEADRARTELAMLEQAEAAAREQWRFASADLARTLRLDPAAVVVPVEPPYLQVTLVSPQESVDELIPIGLTSRPELAAQQAFVQATLARLRQERLRPLIPSLVLEGEPTPAAPGGFLMGGVFGSDVSGRGNPWTARNDVNVQLLWEMRNLGFGNRALVRERRAEQQQAVIELYRTQDRVAAEVAQADAQVRSAAVRVPQAEFGLKEAQVNFAGNLKGMSETTRFGALLTLVNRPQEVVAALQQLAQAYDNYFTTINDYNRAQFRLYRALGYPAGILACERSPGEIKPVDTTRPPQMAPVCAPEPCQCPR
jgi:outer membrane protein TolC